MKKSKRDDQPPFVMLEYELLNSAAWTASSPLVHDFYTDLKKEFKASRGGFDYLPFPYSKWRWKVCKETFYNVVIPEAVKYGLVDIKEHGGLYKRPNIFKLSERWRRISIDIVNKEGREAIRQGTAKKRGHRPGQDLSEFKDKHRSNG